MNGWNKHKFVHHFRHLQIKTGQLALLVCVFTLISIYFLRQNNLKMVEFRNMVVQADEQGGDVAGSLERLNAHVFAHMNTTIVRPIELVNTYNKQAKVAIEAANQGSGRDLYAEAAEVCERKGIPVSSLAQCAANYIETNSAAIEPQAIKLPDKNRFIYSFATPRWTPDAAGFSVLITVVLLLWLIARILEYVLVRLVIRRRLKNSF